MMIWTRRSEFVPEGATNLEYCRGDVVLELMLWPPGHYPGYKSSPVLQLAVRRGNDTPQAEIHMKNYFQLELLLDRIGVPYPDGELKRKWLHMANPKVDSGKLNEEFGESLSRKFEEQGTVYERMPQFEQTYKNLVSDPLIGFTPKERNRIEFLTYLRTQGII